MKRNKKGQVANSSGTMITLVLGVGIAILLMIFVGSLGGQVYQTTENDINIIGTATTYSNDQFTASNASAVALDKTNINNGSLNIYNGTAHIGIGNFTVNYTGGTVRLTGAVGSSFNATVLTANYTYDDSTIRDEINGAIVNSFSALEKTGSYMPLLVLASVIGIVLFIVLGFTRISGSGGGSVL